MNFKEKYVNRTFFEKVIGLVGSCAGWGFFVAAGKSWGRYSLALFLISGSYFALARCFPPKPK